MYGFCVSRGDVMKIESVSLFFFGMQVGGEEGLWMENVYGNVLIKYVDVYFQEKKFIVCDRILEVFKSIRTINLGWYVCSLD